MNSSDATPIAQQFDLTPSQISSSTQIRFITNTLSFEGVSSSIYFDDIDISYDAHGSAPILDLDDDDSSLAVGANFATTFTEDGGAVVVADADAVLTDADSTTLTELVVTIINPLDGAAESLSANTAGTSITASYDPATATLTLSGTDTVANYQQVLRTITYDNTSQSPNTAAARTITFQASDGTDHSDVAFATVTVITVNDPATAVDSGLTVSDVDNTTLTGATVTISANYVNGEDVLGFTDQLGITGSWNAATGTLTLTGTTTLANYQVALRTITYANTSNDPSTLARTMSFVVNDGSANSLAAARTINITAVNDAPVITSNGGGVSASVSITENTTAVTTVAATDADVPAQSLTYSISGGADQGLFSINPSTGALSFNTTPNFEAPADVGADNVYDVTVQVWDGIIGGTDTQAIAVTVTNVNEPPVVNDQAFSVAENTANGTPVGTVIAADVDAGDTRT
ncbi:MAG: cadherin domain-containing protein, partial [Gammaproteobacteria bacterium]